MDKQTCYKYMSIDSLLYEYRKEGNAIDYFLNKGNPERAELAYEYQNAIKSEIKRRCKITPEMIKNIDEFTKKQTYIEAQTLLNSAYFNIGTVKGEHMCDTFTIGVIKHQLKDAMQKFAELGGQND